MIFNVVSTNLKDLIIFRNVDKVMENESGQNKSDDNWLPILVNHLFNIQSWKNIRIIILNLKTS